MIRTVLLILFAGMLMSPSCENASGSDMNTDEQTGNMKADAVVTKEHGEENCDRFLLQVETGGLQQYLSPVELAPEFQKEGLNVAIEFHTSRIRQEDCFNAQPIVIDKIEKR